MNAVGHMWSNLSRLGEWRAAPPIGFDLGREQLSLVQMEAASRECAIRAAGIFPYPRPLEEMLESPREFKAFVLKAFRSADLAGRRVVTSLPQGGATLLNLKCPHVKGEVVPAQVVAEVVSSLGGVAGDYVIDYLPVRLASQGDRETSILAVVARRDKVIPYLELLRRAGLDVLALDAGPAALRRVVAALERGQAGHPTVLMVNVCKQQSYLTVVAGRRLVTDRKILMGAGAMIERLSQALQIEETVAEDFLRRYGLDPQGLPEHEGASARELAVSIGEILQPLVFELAEEINKTLVYLASESRGQPVQQIYLFGRMARFRGGDRLIARMLSIPVTVFDPLQLFPVSTWVSVPVPAATLSIATGLALRGMLDE